MSLEDASTIENFIVLHKATDYSEEVPAGFIASQSISGHALPNTVITVVISKGSQYRTLPGIVGLTVDEAKVALEVYGFVLGSSTYIENPELPSGTIIALMNPDLIVGEKYLLETVVDVIVVQNPEDEGYLD